MTSTGLARSLPPSATTDGALERARQRSPTSAIDPRPEHTGERSLPGATPLFTARRCTSRCSGDARPHRSLRSEVSSARGAEAGSGPELDIQSPPSAPPHWRVTGSSESGLGPPRERRANGRTLGNEPGCLSLCEIRPFLFEPDWPAQRAHARRARASSHPRNGRRIVDGSAPFPGRQPAGTTRQQRVAQSACSARTTSAKRSFASRCAANFDIHHSQSDSPIKTKHGEFAHFSVHNLHRSAGAQRHSFRTLQANTLCTAAELPLRRNQVTPKSDIGVVQQEQ